MSRTKTQKAAARKRLSQPQGPLKPIDFAIHPPPDWMTRAYQNNRYVVMVEDGVQLSNSVTATRAMVQRHDDKPLPHHWREMQAIKNELFGEETTAIEYYPPESQLTNRANIYWLWIMPEGSFPVP